MEREKNEQIPLASSCFICLFLPFSFFVCLFNFIFQLLRHTFILLLCKYVIKVVTSFKDQGLEGLEGHGVIS